MSQKLNGNRVLGGHSGTVWIDNIEFATLTDITVNIDIDREDVQWGLGKKSKMVGMTGTGSLTIDKVYTTASKYFKNMVKGKDYLVTITCELNDLDAVGGQVERWTINDAWFNNLPILELSRGAKLAESYDFGFDATEIDFENEIN